MIPTAQQTLILLVSHKLEHNACLSWPRKLLKKYSQNKLLRLNDLTIFGDMLVPSMLTNFNHQIIIWEHRTFGT